jgi:hypothetical protein
MVKFILIALLSLSLHAKNLYEHHCVSCHEGMTITLDKFFFRYLLKYSSEEGVKNALHSYLKEPKAENSILDASLINRIGVKKRTTLNDKELQEAVHIYWETYNVFEKLR